MLEPKPISNLPMYYLGVAVGLLGLFFMVLDEIWLAVVDAVFSVNPQEHQQVSSLIEIVPAVMLVAGAALMLRARKARKIELPNNEIQ